MRVGQEYRIVPVGLPNGVFHPKCVHLISEDEQLLLVGSGNVTFGGHGRNAEVFEALVPSQHATAFADFADFLLEIGTHPRIQIAQRDWIDDFAARASQAAGQGVDGAGEPVRLIHPIGRPAIEQLGIAAAAIGSCSEVRIISPYHDPDGEAVRALLDAVGADGGVVAVTDERFSPFPFADANSWPRSVIPMKPAIEGNRFVHAKLIELTFARQRFMLSGSFNATRKSLGTTDNVELGVLRHINDIEFLDWEECDPPSFEPADRLPSGLGLSEIVYASFDRQDSHKLTGQLISLQEAIGEWSYRVVQADGMTHAGMTSLKSDGSFAVFDQALEIFAELPALQIVLQRDGREARGWIHNEMLLSVGSRRRLTAGALSRLMRREGSDDDIQALLDYLSVAADRHLRVFDLPISKNPEQEGPADGRASPITVRVNLEELRPLPELPSGNVGGGSTGIGTDDQFETALVRLRRMLLGHGLARNAPSRDGLSSTILAEDEEDERRRKTPDQIAYILGLQDFEQAIGRMIDDCAGHPNKLPGLMAIQLEIGMWMRLHRFDDTDGAFEFLGGWLKRTAQKVRQQQDKVTALSQHYVTGTAIRAALMSSTRRPGHLVGLHDDLEKFFGGALDRSFAFSSLIDDAEKGFARALAQGQQSIDLHTALGDVLATRTRRQQLEDALQLRAEERPVPGSWEVFLSATGKTLLEAVHRTDWERRVKRALPNFEACSHCYCGFPLHEKLVFRRERIGRCIHCGKFSLNVTP